MPLGMRCDLVGATSNAEMTSRAMKRELASTWLAAVGQPRLDGVDRRRGRPAARGRRAGRSPVLWNVVTSGAPWSAASVSAAQATCQSWACTTSGDHVAERVDSCTRWWLADAAPADEEVVGQPRQVDAGPQHAHVGVALLGRCGPGLAQREHHDVVAGPPEGTGEPVDVGGVAADGVRREVPGRQQHAHGADAISPARCARVRLVAGRDRRSLRS